MHQPNDEPRKSVYYRYQVFPPHLPRETEARQKVVIVGAGPVGMTLALLLARYRVPSVIVE
jgi:3-(3-hydroxy-phenyl)propionate hydroxylase